MRVAYFSPLPPERTGIGDYSYELLEELRGLLDVTAVVSDDVLYSVRAPDGVEVVGASSVREDAFDCNIYQMGNNPNFHRFIYGRAFEEPGLLVLHDPSLADFTAEMCGDAQSTIFREEVAYDRPEIGPDDDLPLVDAGKGRIDLDRLEVLLARRIIESNVRTLVHSAAMAREMTRRYQGSDIATIQLPAQLVPDVPRPAARQPGEVVFGVFGGINYYKRILPIVEAFADVRSRHPLARMVVAGRSDDRLLEIEVRRIAERRELGGALEVKTNLRLEDLEREMSLCDVGISLRWPTAGEMSATLMRTLGAGRPAIVSDVLQFRELDSRYCWRVTTDFDHEHDSLVELMDAAASDPERCRRAGDAARRFVEREATYRVVAEQYVRHVEHCASRRDATRERRRHLLLATRAVLGANLFTPGGDGEAAMAGRRLGEALRSDGVDVVVVELAPPLGPVAESVETEDPSDGDAADHPSVGGALSGGGGEDERAWAHAARAEAAAHARRDRALVERAERQLDRADIAVAGRGPHIVDLYVTDDRGAQRAGSLARVRRARGHRVVAVLSPGLVPFTTDYRLLLELAEQVWVPGEHGAEVAAMSTTVPVAIVPWPAGLPDAAVPDAAVPDAAGDPAGGGEPRPCGFLAYVDASSGISYANPFAVVDAFRAAFPHAQRGVTARLVLAFGGVGSRPEAAERLAEDVARVRGTFVADPSPGELRALMAASDVYVSLHRSEPFGLQIADAMAQGKVVVVAGWSSLDGHTSGRDSCRVGYSVCDVADADAYLDAGTGASPGSGYLWIEPDVDGAARWMQRLAADPARRQRMGAAARATAAAHLSSRSVGRAGRTALATLVATSRRADETVDLAAARGLVASSASGDDNQAARS
ncbi:MAG: glycosyltransferase [Acidimicrobiales bacterium]